MGDNNKQANLLQQLIYDTIALGKAMKLQVTHLSSNAISIEAPVANANMNIHGTAFAGSIYSICALSAWGLVHMRLLTEDISAEVVLAQANIRYLLPIKDSIRTNCVVDETDFEEFQTRLLRKGKASLSVTVNAEENDKVQASLDARVVVKIITS